MELDTEHAVRRADDEPAKVALLRAAVEAQDPMGKEADDLELRRFLRARNLDVDKAALMFLKYLTWRRATSPAGFIGEREVAKELSLRKLYLQGVDKAGRPVAVLLAARHFPSKHGLDEFKRFVVYCLDKISERIPPGSIEKFTCIVDLDSWRRANLDIRGYLAALDIMQNYYPERLGKALMIHVPQVFMLAWKIIQPFIDEETKKKFIFVEDKKLQETLQEHIDVSQLPEIYGGKMPLVTIDGKNYN